MIELSARAAGAGCEWRHMGATLRATSSHKTTGLPIKDDSDMSYACGASAVTFLDGGRKRAAESSERSLKTAPKMSNDQTG